MNDSRQRLTNKNVMRVDTNFVFICILISVSILLALNIIFRKKISKNKYCRNRPKRYQTSLKGNSYSVWKFFQTFFFLEYLPQILLGKCRRLIELYRKVFWQKFFLRLLAIFVVCTTECYESQYYRLNKIMTAIFINWNI